MKPYKPASDGWRLRRLRHTQAWRDVWDMLMLRYLRRGVPKSFDRYSHGPGAPLTGEAASRAWAAHRAAHATTREPTCYDAEVSTGGHWWPAGAVPGDPCLCGEKGLPA